jgi:hypothetical protein
VRERLGQRATLEAPARARASAKAAARERRVVPRRGGEPVRARTEKQLAYERRCRQERARTQKRAAKLLGQGMTQQAVAAELGVTTRTLRNWKAAPGVCTPPLQASPCAAGENASRRDERPDAGLASSR